MRHQATLRYVDAIARHGSIRRAADALAITPSALNRRLLALEEELGAPLFERRARGVRLSAAGELFVHQARRQIADMARVRATIEDMKGARRGHVAIALDASVDPDPLIALIAQHRAAHPGVTFAMLPCDRANAAEMLEDYRADLALVVEPDRGTGFATLSTIEHRVAVLTQPGHPLARKNALRLHDLLTLPLVLPPSGRSLRFLLDVAAARRELALEPAMVADAEAARLLVRGGTAIGFHLQATEGWGSEVDADAFASLPLASGDTPPATLHLGQLRDRSLPVPAARFAESIRARFEGR